MGRWYRRRDRKGNLTALIILLVLGMIMTYPLQLLALAFLWLTWRGFKKWYLRRSETYQETQSQENHYQPVLPYRKKESQVTRAELNFYNLLKDIVGDKFDIQRQVVISSIVDVTSANFTDYRTGRQFNPDRSKIDKKTIDFVLFNKNDFSPYMAIELDDKSHERTDRMIRDEEVEMILESVEIPLVRIKTAYEYNKENLIEMLKLTGTN